eukprot:10776604-Ditylum_brightwellii.AAC.1
MQMGLSTTVYGADRSMTTFCLLFLKCPKSPKIFETCQHYQCAMVDLELSTPPRKPKGIEMPPRNAPIISRKHPW